MKVLERHLRDYLEMRRGLGFELDRVESRLRNFLAFLEARRARQITTALALEFASRPDHRAAPTQAGCLSAIRGFAHYLSGLGISTEIPPAGLIRRGYRPQPYIYSDEEIRRILNAARQHPSTQRYALKPFTLYCLLGLLSVTGMRLTEALNLRPEDIDWQQGVLTIGRAKFQKSRLVPLHPSTLRQLQAYKRRRDRFFAQRPWRRPANLIFVSTHGGPLTGNEVGHDFRMLTRQIGLRRAGSSKGPRIHDLRHRFAVSTLLRWYRSGRDVEVLLPVLSTYLGHVFITGTYWYLTCTPELMEAAGRRLESRWKGVGRAQS
jgi:integrase/recombinase XerD